jgi:hypothetical protein
MVRLLFRCPRTGMNVQHSVADDASLREDPSSYYDAVSCAACTRLHFVNRATGKTLGDKDKEG